MYQPPKAIYKFVRAERNRGESKKDGKPYDFATIRVSDQHDSFNLDVLPELADEMKDSVRKGDFIEVTYEVGERFKNTTHTIVSFKKLQQHAKIG